MVIYKKKKKVFLMMVGRQIVFGVWDLWGSKMICFVNVALAVQFGIISLSGWDECDLA